MLGGRGIQGDVPRLEVSNRVVEGADASFWRAISLLSTSGLELPCLDEARIRRER